MLHSVKQGTLPWTLVEAGDEEQLTLTSSVFFNEVYHYTQGS